MHIPNDIDNKTIMQMICKMSRRLLAVQFQEGSQKSG
jgi:hypothetical protein